MVRTEDNTVTFKSGFVAIAGAPNVGKSTLMNRILGEKISITSSKPQTTRNRILGVLHRPNAQLVFIDTPGIHKARSPLNIRIVDTALSVLGDVDLILLVADASEPDSESEAVLINKLHNQNRPVLLVLNKIDLIKKSQHSEIIEKASGRYLFEKVVPVSAKHGSGIDALVQTMEALLPQGPPFFPSESLTDLPERFIAAEMIREKVFRLTGQEIPYATAVTVDLFQVDDETSLVKIDASIHVERDSQKGIIIGKNGAKLKEIGAAARKEIEKMVGAKVFLKLFVRVQKNWSKDTKALRRFGY
ncbi:MAG: GTPase Era [Desulfobacterales bacterium]|nr:GTPase Era [Desulfobacterales bacterium]